MKLALKTCKIKSDFEPPQVKSSANIEEVFDTPEVNKFRYYLKVLFSII